jgi:uncharacterized membrane protein YfcA
MTSPSLSFQYFLDALSVYPTNTLILICGAAFVAGLARGFSGFGSALIFVPFASAFVGPQIASPILAGIDIVCSAGLLPDAVRNADKKDVGAMSIGAIVAVPAGVAMLVYVDPVIVRWVISVTALAFLVLLISGWRYRGKPSAPLAVGVGLVAGVYSGAAQMGGPPVVAYWLGGVNKIATVRANIVLYFAIADGLTVIGYFFAGLLNSNVIMLALLCGPIFGVGLFLGAKSFRFASELTFRRICYVLIGFAALVSLPLLDSLR